MDLWILARFVGSGTLLAYWLKNWQRRCFLNACWLDKQTAKWNFIWAKKKSAFSSTKVEMPNILKTTPAGKMPVCQPQEKVSRKKKSNAGYFPPPFPAPTSTVVQKIPARPVIQRAKQEIKESKNHSLLWPFRRLLESWLLPTPLLHEHGGDKLGLWDQ